VLQTTPCWGSGLRVVDQTSIEIFNEQRQPSLINSAIEHKVQTEDNLQTNAPLSCDSFKILDLVCTCLQLVSNNTEVNHDNNCDVNLLTIVGAFIFL